jgi:membrane protein
MKCWWILFRQAAANWSRHKDARQGAALAYYSIFSLGPLMVIAIAIAGLVFGQDAFRGEIVSQLKELLGDDGAEAVETLLARASKPQQGIVATVVRLSDAQRAPLSDLISSSNQAADVYSVSPVRPIHRSLR